MADVTRLPHGYSNMTCVVDGIVEKRHQGPLRHVVAEREVGLLRALADRLPVPSVVSFEPEGPVLQLELIEGVNGQALLGEGQAARVLFECGRLLRRIQELDPGEFDLPGDGSCLVHGDYGPHNLLFDLAVTTVRGVVDWEWARLGQEVEDLAWAEWIVRYHHPDRVEALPSLFEGYGAEPPWQERHRDMIANCRRALERARGRGNPQVIESWHERIARTAEF